MQTLTDSSNIPNQQMKIDQNILNQSQSNLDFDKIKDFNSKSVDLIFDDKIESALDILKKIEVFLETNAIESKTILDKKILIIILHNLACCYQKVKDFDNCISYLEAVIYHFDSSLEPKHKIKIKEDYFIKSINQDQSSYSLLGDFILELRFSAKFHLQMCAVLSQANRHVEALSHAKLAALMCEDNLIKTYYLYYQMKDKGISKGNNKKKIDDEFSMFAEKIKRSYKIIKDLFNRVLSTRGINNNSNNNVITTSGNQINNNNIHKNPNKNSNSFIDLHSGTTQLFTKNNINTNSNDNTFTSGNFYDSYFKYRSNEISTYNSNTFLITNIRNVFGSSIKKEDWIQLLNIGNIMYLSALNYEDLDLDSDPKYELLRDAILEKVVMLTVAYFCIATELRFLSPDKNNSNTNGEFYHYKAVEYASLFLPVSCPIVKHYIYSYYKHYGNDLSVIPEGGVFNMKIELLRSEIEQDKDTLTFLTTKKINYTSNLNASIMSIKSETAGNNYHNRKEFNLLRGSAIVKGKIDSDKAPKFRLDFAGLNSNRKKDDTSSLSVPSNTNKDNLSTNKKDNNKELIETNNLLLGLKPKLNNDNNNTKASNFKLNFMNIGKPCSYEIHNKEYDLFQNNNQLAKKSKINGEKGPKFHLNFMNLNKNVNNENEMIIKQNKKGSNSSNKCKKAETARIKTGKIKLNKNSPFYCGNINEINNTNGISNNSNNINKTNSNKQKAETDRLKIDKIQLSKGMPFYSNTNIINVNHIKGRKVSASKKKNNGIEKGIKFIESRKI